MKVSSPRLICLALVLLASLISGCKEKKDIEKDLNQVYIKGHGEGAKGATAKIIENLAIQRGYGYTPAYVPVREPAWVQKVWIPDHLGTDDVLVSGHWVYIVIEESKWHIQQPRYPARRMPVITPQKSILEEVPVERK